MTELQKMALKESFSFGGKRMVVAVHDPEGSAFGYVNDLVKARVEKFVKAFGIDPNSLKQNVNIEWCTPALETRRFSDIGERNAFIRRHYCEDSMFDVRPTALNSDDMRFLKESETELMETDGFYSDYQRYGNVSLEYWEERLNDYLFGIDLRNDYKNYISSFFSSANRGMWVNVIKARALVKAIHSIHAKMRIIEVSPIPLEF